MAKVLFGDATLSGKLGSRVFAYNKAGFYVRQYRKPTDPATSAQLNNRSTFANTVSSWHALSDAQKGQWNVFANGDFKAKFPKSGVAYSGFNAFVSLQNVALQMAAKAGEAEITLPATADFTAGAFVASPNAPEDPLSASIKDTEGGTYAVSLLDVQWTYGSSIFTVQIGFDRPIVPGATTNKPNFADATGEVPLGIAIVGSLPIVQQNMFVENPDINLMCVIPPIGEISPWTLSSSVTFECPGVPELMTRKNTYKAGDIIQFKAYLVGNNGMTQPIGSVKRTVGEA